MRSASAAARVSAKRCPSISRRSRSTSLSTGEELDIPFNSGTTPQSRDGRVSPCKCQTPAASSAELGITHNGFGPKHPRIHVYSIEELWVPPPRVLGDLLNESFTNRLPKLSKCHCLPGKAAASPVRAPGYPRDAESRNPHASRGQTPPISAGCEKTSCQAGSEGLRPRRHGQQCDVSTPTTLVRRPGFAETTAARLNPRLAWR